MKKKHPARKTVICILLSFILLEIICGIFVPYNKIAVKKLYRYNNNIVFDHHGLITYMTYTDLTDLSQKPKRYLIPNISFFCFSWFTVVPQDLEAVNESRYYSNAMDADKYEIDLTGNPWLHPTERGFRSPVFPQDEYDVHVIADSGCFPEQHDGQRIIEAASFLVKIPFPTIGRIVEAQ